MARMPAAHMMHSPVPVNAKRGGFGERRRRLASYAVAEGQNQRRTEPGPRSGGNTRRPGTKPQGNADGNRAPQRGRSQPQHRQDVEMDIQRAYAFAAWRSALERMPAVTKILPNAFMAASFLKPD